MHKTYIRENITLVSIILFIVIFGLIQMTKPLCFYNKDGSIREFGIGYKNKTILPLWLLSLVLGKLFKLSNKLSLLLGIGNGICGSSAIAGASQVIDADENDIGISIAIINILGAVGIFFVPFMIGEFFKGDFYDQGIIIGSTIQAVGQVTAAGFIMGDEIGEVATLVKMIRILMLGPVLIILSFMYRQKNRKINKKSMFSIPPFIIGFFVLFIMTNYHLIPDSFLPYLKMVSKYCLLFAMTAIGLNVSIKAIFKTGYKAVLVSSITFMLQIILVIYILGN